MLDHRLTTPLLIALALLLLFCFLVLAKGGVWGLAALPPIILAFAAFVRAWTGKDDPPDPPPPISATQGPKVGA